ALAAGPAHPRAQLRLARQSREPVGEPVDVPGLDEEAVLAVPDDVRYAADARRDDRPRAGERLDHAHRRALVRGRQDERVERGVERRDVLLVAEEQAMADDAELRRAPLDVLAVGPVADHAERRVDLVLAEALERAQHVVGALDAG